MDGILDNITLKQKYHGVLDDDTVRYELRTRGYLYDRGDSSLQGTLFCSKCEVGVKGEVWKKPIITTKKKQDWVWFRLYYCPACSQVVER